MALPTIDPTKGVPPPSGPRGVRFEPLGRRAPVAVRRGACLRLRTHLAACDACASSCPTQALRPGAQSLEVSDAACTGCGRCQAACPTGALAVDGFDAAVRPRDGALSVDCHRAPPSAQTWLRVPCLGGLTAARLLTLCASTAGRADARVVLVDRGLCTACDSGGSEHPARATLQRAAALMSEAGVPDAALPVIERLAGAGRAAVDPMQQSGRGRRGFLGALARPPAQRPPGAGAAATSEPSTERRQTATALQQLVARHGGRMPASLFHRLEVSAACRGHRVCASACPTGALLRYRDDAAAGMGIAFDAAECIGCGHCAALCPEQALLLRRGGGSAVAGHRPLTRFAQRVCAECGSRFAATAAETQTRCGRCRTSAGLARSAFQTLFGAGPRTPGNGVTFKEELR